MAAKKDDSDCFVFETLSTEGKDEASNHKECIYRALLSGLFYMPPERILKTQSGWGWPMRYDSINELTLPWKNAEVLMPPGATVEACYSSRLLFESFQYMEIPRRQPDGRVGHFRVYKLHLWSEKVQIWNDHLEAIAARDAQVKTNNIDVSNAGGYHSHQNFFSTKDDTVQAVADAMRLGVQMVEVHDAGQVILHRSNGSNGSSSNNIGAVGKDIDPKGCQDCYDCCSLPSDSPDNDQHDSDDLHRRSNLQQQQRNLYPNGPSSVPSYPLSGDGDGGGCGGSSISVSGGDSSSVSDGRVRTFEHDAEAWLNLSKHGAWNRLHNHVPAAWSGCYYIKVPETRASRPYSGDFMIKPSPLAKELKQNLTATEIERLNLGHNTASAYTYSHSSKIADYVSVRPEEGSVLFFPSYVHHAVVPLYTKDDGEQEQQQYRVSMAFNFNERKS